MPEGENDQHPDHPIVRENDHHDIWREGVPTSPDHFKGFFDNLGPNPTPEEVARYLEETEGSK